MSNVALDLDLARQVAQAQHVPAVYASASAWLYLAGVGALIATLATIGWRVRRA